MPSHSHDATARRAPRTLLLLPALAVVLAACTAARTTNNAAGSGGDGGDTSPVECDPLVPAPTTLQAILGVGKDAQGALYVSDLPAGLYAPRVFVSSAGELLRQHVAGSGEGGGGAEYTLLFESYDSDGSDAQSLLLQVQGTTATSMALGPAGSKSFVGGTPLTLVAASTVAGMKIVNLPNVFAYVADVSDGSVIVVTTPMDASSSEDFRLFYGPTNAALQRTIVSFEESGSGYPTITFTVGATDYTMTIGVVFAPDSGPFGEPAPGTLRTGGATLSVTLRDPTPTALAGVSFLCSGT